ncbi:MAG TPA: alpha/beta hydrolase [Cryomorphaceae bacterium]|nr:carboxylesterase [Owenweeksia sp.]MBF98273.1 carboxylesterase [Owenweeksia sp.]HAD96460.1 alpha/beta hydrolase [Cryomorphaceae bacterium]HBF19388.1 alpha/beta hydrolase [Cryomorphaceae bacterium]
MTAFSILVFVLLPFLVIVGYQYFKVELTSPYTFETMPLNYEIIGSGDKKLVFIHGLTGSKNYWKREIETVSKTHQLLLVDLLGFGDSPKPNSDYSLNVQLNALERIITKENFNDGKTVIVGHSMGAIISLALLAEHSNWFEGAIITGLPVYKDRNEFKEIMSKHSVFDRLTSGKYGPLICMLHPIFMTDYFKPDNLTEDVYEDAKKHTWQSYANSLTEVVIKPDLYAFSKAIKDEKIVFIHGMEDTSAPYESAKEYAETFSNAEFITIKGGDHQLFLKEPNILWKAIDDFSVSEDHITETVGQKAVKMGESEQALKTK